MNGVSFGVQIDLDQVVSLLERAPQATVAKIRQLVEAAAIDVQRQMMTAAPTAVTGQLRSSIRYTMTMGDPISAEVKPAASYAEDVENGTSAHFVSVAPGTPLFAWAALKGVDPFALEESISEHGTFPHPFVAPTYDIMRDPVQNLITNGLAKFAEDLDNGSI